MAMYPFRYCRPVDTADAARLYAEAEDAAYLSGGHTLLPALKQRLARPSALIDLTALAALRGLTLRDGVLTIGAATTHAEVAQARVVQDAISALAGLAGSIGDRHVRHRGTIGGSVANNDPAADYPSAVLGLGATVVTDRRRIPADDFFVSLYETALAPGEMITAIEFPIPDIAGYAKFRSPASRFAVAAVFISKSASSVRVAVTGAGIMGVFRAHDIENALMEDFRPEALAGIRIDPDLMLSDLNGSSAYRASLTMVMARRAVQHIGEARSYK